MQITTSIEISPEAWADEAMRRHIIAHASGIREERITHYNIIRKSIDARSRSKGPLITATLEVFADAPPKPAEPFDPQLRNVAGAPEAYIAGAGPAGLFAALKLIAQGIRPIILERGKDVRARRRDLAALNKQGIVNPESNYCFGEGGAGTYSDGKLYTRATKRGDVARILNLFVHFGAPEEIRYEAHPHIGTNKLPGIITAMREAIIACGGEVRFGTKLTGIQHRGGKLTDIEVNGDERIQTSSLILATGHSARDVFELLHRSGILIEAKPFALGVRIEHPQELIDRIQYHCVTRSPYLPPSAYSLVSQQEGRGVFSFCMCPGGIIAPAATAPGELVVNGWSPSRRNNPYANSGTVVAVSEQDFAKHGFQGPLAAMQYQRAVEQRAFAAGGNNMAAPAQRMEDFVQRRISKTLPDSSYVPGLHSAQMDAVLPPEVASALRLALQDFGKKMRGYFTNEAVLVATESRTSSPVRIPRDKDSLQHPQVAGLYPCAEGAGYAGGIVSAAMDGERCADAVAVHRPRL